MGGTALPLSVAKLLHQPVKSFQKALWTLEKQMKSFRSLLKRKIMKVLLFDQLTLMKKPSLRSIAPFLPSPTGFPV